jgi:hypothetical protein
LSKEESLAEWRAYFDALLNNKNTHANAANHPPAATIDQKIKTNQIFRQEVVEAIKGLKSHRAPGPDHALTAEVIKEGGQFTIDELTRICKLAYTEKRAPDLWPFILIFTLPKRGDPELMTNYRGISLMPIAAQLYNRILLFRIRNNPTA